MGDSMAINDTSIAIETQQTYAQQTTRISHRSSEQQRCRSATGNVSAQIRIHHNLVIGRVRQHSPENR
jgi:hypothetical protein